MATNAFRYGVLELTGRDSFSFLQAQLATDLRAVVADAAHAAQPACLLNPQGRVLAFGMLLKRDAESWQWLLEAELVPDILLRLGKFVLRSKVSLRAREDLGVALALEPAQCTDPAGRGIQVDAALVGAELSIESRLHAIRYGLIDFAKEHQDLYLADALQLALWRAVSLTKGCFPGQEVVARMHYLGRGKRHLRLFAAERQPNLMSELSDAAGASVGRWLCALPDGNGWLGLAVIEDRAVGQLQCVAIDVTAVTVTEIQLLSQGNS